MSVLASPDCRSGKHQACRGDAYDFDRDALAYCPCDCHTVEAALAAAGVHVLRFEYSTKPIDMNGSRGGHWAHGKRVREVKDHTAWLAKAGRVPKFDRAQIGLFWYVRTAGRRDADNLSATYKAMADGLVLAGVLDDDHDGIVRRHMAEIRRVDPRLFPAAWMELVIAPVDTDWDPDYRKAATP